MPNTSVPSAGEAMPAANLQTIDRRRLLLGTGATAAALGAVSTLPATELTETTDEMTDDQFAALPFTAWVHTPGEWTPPTNVEWAKLANPHLISIRIAWLIMHKTKPELVEMIEGMDEDLFMTTFSALDDTADWLKHLNATVNGALARLACVGMSGAA